MLHILRFILEFIISFFIVKRYNVVDKITNVYYWLIWTLIVIPRYKYMEWYVKRNGWIYKPDSELLIHCNIKSGYGNGSTLYRAYVLSKHWKKWFKRYGSQILYKNS